ncbi:MAG: PTS sugar transporter subunit IIA [Nitrospina sp.]|jgi:PTS system nitrogen regulatory IIA component|nr:PTS sugar transporter subunit IIA [Nitrospina sp.]MBT3414358.1 PTS sugar transporter subunit IIA [Nitrospina sp.]MBT3857594.1 PTS sugar transporter subunit IIA [Nitrospina sp.]MBT4103474.1 PTS sugar transporter subunit IIA [Nitrospina sp.]MBT4389139.1 PTS sugar transporter subunit IIA [Nitrospina sp.]
MKIDDILKKDSIIANLAGVNKGEILREITDFLQKQGLIKDKETLLNTLMEREKLGSTGIGENVAIPHGKSDELSQIITVFGRSLQGVDFESLDQKPVHFVCMVIAPSNSTGQHLKALARISRLFKNQDLREGILKLQDANQIYSLLLEADSKFI